MMNYIGEELMVLDMVKEYLMKSKLFTDDDYRPKGGIHIKSKNMPINSDLVEINMLGKLLFIAQEVVALININIYNEYEYRTDELGKVIIRELNGAVINLFDFKIERASYNGIAKRKYQNILFKGTIKNSDYNILVDSYF